MSAGDRLSSGLPLMLTVKVLSARLAEAGVPEDDNGPPVNVGE